MLFRLSKISKSYAGRRILSDVSFQIEDGERVGLVGRNGAGKTTIFHLINGEESPDEGEIAKASRLRIGLLSQHIHFRAGGTVMDVTHSSLEELRTIEKEMRRIEEELSHNATPGLLERYAELQKQFELKDGFSANARCEAMLTGLGFTEKDWNQEAAKLSGGQKNRLALVRLLLSNPDVLLLDEPTNHLDVNATEWLEEFLSDYPRCFLLISHDRYFLDRVCSRMIEVENGCAVSYKGNYTQFLQQREERREAQRRAYENQRAVIEKNEDFIRRNIAGQKTKQAKSRRNMLERLERVKAVTNDKPSGNFVLRKVERAGQQVLGVEDLSLGFGDRILVSGLDLAISRGECLGVIGENGSGKTTFLRALIGEVAPRDGKIIWGTKTKFGYYSQELTDLHDNLEVLQEFRRVAPLAESGEIRSFLARFLFQGEDVFKKVGDLSGGEKGRLALAKLVYSNVNVLILDEPTNHLDIPSREALEDALTIYDGTIIVVSHDRFFLDKLATQILFIGAGKCEHFDGNYTEFHDRNLNNAEFSKSTPPIKKQANIGSKNFSPEKSLSKNERRKLEARNSEIEKEIPRLEELLAKLTFEMSNPEVASVASDYEKTNRSFLETEIQLAKLFEEWQENLEKLKRNQVAESG